MESEVEQSILDVDKKMNRKRKNFSSGQRRPSPLPYTWHYDSSTSYWQQHSPSWQQPPTSSEQHPQASHHSITLHLILQSICLLTVLADVLAVQLIRENGFKENTFYYHLGDGGHAYHFNTETESSIYFKCVLYEKGCHGRAIFRVGGRFRESKRHNHPPDPDFVGERHFRENILQRITEARLSTFEDVLNDARRDRSYSRRVRSKMTLRRLSSAMSRARNKKYPPIPATLADLTRVLLHNRRISETVDEEQNLYAGSVTATDGSHHVAFFTPRMIAFMENVKILQGDGTFRSRPATPASSQCFVIVTTWRNSVIPLGWILMERRTLSAYRAVFQLLKHICPNLNPDVIISDWEYSQQRAWSEAFPNADIQGCLFHLCKAFVAKAKAMGLLRFKRALPLLFTFIRDACAIALLPHQLFEEGLQILRNEALEEDVLVAFLLEPFFTYVEERRIGNNARVYWMSFFKCMHRTNNACETHNRMLRRVVGAYRPNVYLFIEALARLEHNANLDVPLMNAGGNARRTRRWQSVYQDRHLKALSQDLEMDIFQDRDESISNFISSASQLFHGTFDQFLRRAAG